MGRKKALSQLKKSSNDEQLDDLRTFQQCAYQKNSEKRQKSQQDQTFFNHVDMTANSNCPTFDLKNGAIIGQPNGNIPKDKVEKIKRNMEPIKHVDPHEQNEIQQKKRNQIKESEGKKGDNMIGDHPHNAEQSLNNQVGKEKSQIRIKYGGIVKQENIAEGTDTFAKIHDQAVGVIKGTWKNKAGKDYITNFGTAFAVSPWFLLTCQHNLFYEKQHLAASSISFVPGINGPITQSSQVWQSQQQHFYRAKEIKRYQETFSVKPLTNELCLIVLERPLQLTNYVKIGAIKLQKYQRIEIIGYPSESYSKQINIFDVVPKRSHLAGNIIRVQDERVIVHNMPTKVGHSGSPILALDDDNQVVAIGIHTHRGFTSTTNNGLFFDWKVMEMLKNFHEQLKTLHNLSDQLLEENNEGRVLGCQLIASNKFYSDLQVNQCCLEYQEEESEMQNIISNFPSQLTPDEDQTTQINYSYLSSLDLQIIKKVVGKQEDGPALVNPVCQESQYDNSGQFNRKYYDEASTRQSSKQCAKQYQKYIDRIEQSF